MKRMKRKFIFLAVSMAIAFTACEQEAETVATAPITPVTPVADNLIRVSVDNGVTRAGYTSANLTDFGFFVKCFGAPSYTYNNVRMIKGEDGEWNPEDGLTMQWMDLKWGVDILAYAPYQKDETYTTTSQVPANVVADQSSEENLIASDFIAMKWEEFLPYKDTQYGRVPVRMKHLMSQIKLNIRYEADLKNEDGTNPISEVSIVGSCLNGICDFAVTPLAVVAVQGSEETTPILPYQTGDYPEECYVTYECILVPQTTQPSINIVLEGKLQTYKYVHSHEMNLESGHSYSINLRLEGNRIWSE